MSATALPPLARKQPDRRAQARSVGSSASSSSVRLPPIGHAHGSRQVRSDRLGSGGGGISVGNVQITLQELTKPADSFDSIQRDLVDLDLSRFGKSGFESSCLNLLEGGYFRAFVELFNYNEQEKADREAAGKDSGYYYDPLVSDSTEKLDCLQTYLGAAEDAMRRDDGEKVYDAQCKLAQYFEETGDIWLSDRVYQSSLETAKGVSTDGREREGTAHANFGLALEGRGKYAEAAQHFERYFKLAKAADPPWYSMSGESLVKAAAENVARICTTLAEELFDEDQEQSIAYLKKSLDHARHIDTRAEGLAHYRLGNMYQSISNFEKAVDHHKAYLEKSRHCQDQQGLAAACEALALANESLERWDEAINYHSLLQEAAKRSNDQQLLAKAMSQLGTLKNMLGDFDEAVTLMDTCCTIQMGESSSELSDRAVQETRARYSTCKGHLSAANVNKVLRSGVSMNFDCEDLNLLLLWKDTRLLEYPEKVLSVKDALKKYGEASGEEGDDKEDNKKDENPEETLQDARPPSPVDGTSE
eukprot:scpid56873/ scgid29009/ Tetratricopeptide repeat protein 29